MRTLRIILPILAICIVAFSGCKENSEDEPKVEVTGVTLNRTELSLAPGDTEQLIAIIEPEDADNKEVRWESDNPEVATVDADGLVTGIKDGDAIITVTTRDGHCAASCSVKVDHRGKYTGIYTFAINEKTDWKFSNYFSEFNFKYYGQITLGKIASTIIINFLPMANYSNDEHAVEVLLESDSFFMEEEFRVCQGEFLDESTVEFTFEIETDKYIRQITVSGQKDGALPPPQDSDYRTDWAGSYDCEAKVSYSTPESSGTYYYQAWVDVTLKGDSALYVTERNAEGTSNNIHHDVKVYRDGSFRKTDNDRPTVSGIFYQDSISANYYTYSPGASRGIEYIGKKTSK